MAQTALWIGASGKQYTYEIHPVETEWNDVPGNYIFARQLSSGRWTSIYIGQTESLKDRLPDHEKLPCIRQHGGTHIHAHISRDEKARLVEEQDLLNAGPSPCND